MRALFFRLYQTSDLVTSNVPIQMDLFCFFSLRTAQANHLVPYPLNFAELAGSVAIMDVYISASRVLLPSESKNINNLWRKIENFCGQIAFTAITAGFAVCLICSKSKESNVQTHFQNRQDIIVLLGMRVDCSAYSS